MPAIKLKKKTTRRAAARKAPKRARQIVLFFFDRVMTRLAQDADLFEKFKVIANPPVICTVVRRWGKSHLQALLRRAEENPRYGLIAVVGPKRLYYRNPDIQVVSNGSTWSVLDDDCLARLQSLL
jgi:hypothetical protein